MVDSEISSIASCGSRKSSVDTENYMMTLDSLQRRGHAGLNGWNGGFVAGDWKGERNGLLMEILECQRRIQVISQEALEWEISKQEYDKKVQRLQRQLDDANTTRAACDKLKLQRWSRKKSSMLDMRGPTPPHEHMDDPQELMLAFLESERQYVNRLTVLDMQYQQPMKMLSAFKPDILSLQQLQFLFLNCSELLNLHRYLFEELTRVQFLPHSIQLNQFFTILERNFPKFSLYNPFLGGSRQQNVQKELRALRQKPEFMQLLDHCNKGCEGVNLEQLLTLPCERLNDYSTLLTVFLSPKLRDIADESVKRADNLIRFIRTMKYELQDERSDWDHMLEKIKLLQRLDPDFPVPLEIFDSDTRLIKQGQLNQVIAGGKEVPRFCFLFSNYMALAEADKFLRILEHGMIPLCGAQLHKIVDIEGQPLTADLKSGRLEDRLAFRVSFVDNESLYFRVAKPNLRKAWVEALEKCIQESSDQVQCDSEDVPLTQLYPDIGPKIAAASLEKLFQQLTSPHNFQDNFMEVFLMTHLSFTTSRDVLEALINCMQSPGALSDAGSHMSANAVFTFSMESDTVESEHLSCTHQYSDADQFSLNSPIPSRARTCAISTDSPKKSSSMRASVSTSDSDVSPHTSTVVENGIMQNGWTNCDISLKIPPCNKRGSSGDSETDYVMFFRGSRNSSEMDFGDNEDSGNEDNAGTPRPSLTDCMAFRVKSKAKKTSGELGAVRTEVEQIKINETSIEEEEEQVHGEEEKKDAENKREPLSRTERMNRDLDETSLMLEKLTQSLFPVEKEVPANGSDLDDNSLAAVEPESSLTAAVVKRVHTDWQKPRHSTVSASISEPDLTQIAIKKTTPPVKRGHIELSIPVPMPPGQRPGTPTDKLTNSLSLSQTYSPSPFLHGKALMSPTHKRRMFVNAGSPLHSAEDRFSSSGKHRGSKSHEQSVMSHFKKRGSMKNDTVKNETNKKPESPSTPNRFGNRKPSLTKSSSFFSPNPVENGTKPQKSRGITGGGLKGIWKRNSRKKASVKADSEEWVDVGVAVEQSPGRDLQRRLSLKRKNSLAGDKLEPLAGCRKSPLYSRKAGTINRNGPMSLVTKIFQVLDFWQDMHFEDFGEDVSLTQMLESFLCGLLERSCSNSKDAVLGQKLLDDVTRKTSLYSTDCSFAALLTRTYHLDPDVVKHFTWNSTQRQPCCRDIDLGKGISKDSKDNMLRVIAEQMTLIEFAVYRAVKRRELLNVNWKKPNREEKAPNVCRLIRRTNEMTSWVCTEILVRDSPSSRATVVEHFIQIALYCYRHNDLHCSLNITIALSSSIIRGLRKTWEEVDKKFHDKFKKLRELTDYQGRCKKLRERLEQTTMDHLHKTGEIPAALPYIGGYLDQIYSLEMCTKTYNKDGLVNFTKMTKLAEMVARTLVYQKTRFKFEPRLDIIAYLTSTKRLSENELYELSCQTETTSKP